MSIEFAAPEISSAWPPTEDGEAARIRCERAAAELRYGRPVRIVSPQREALAVLALDTASRETYEAFAARTDGRSELYLTTARARAIGLDAPRGALLPLAGKDFREATHLGYLRGAITGEAWRDGTTLRPKPPG